jgi:hypothetical protein
MPQPRTNRRNLYRVVYPREQRPVFVASEGTWPVIDLSEGGLRILVRGDYYAPRPRTTVLEDGTEQVVLEPARVEGEVRLPDGRGRFPVAGTAIHRVGLGVGVAFDVEAGLAMTTIVGEQRHLIKIGALRRDDDLDSLREELGLPKREF